MKIVADYKLLSIPKDNEESLENLIQKGIENNERELNIKALFMVKGYEYKSLLERSQIYVKKFDSFFISNPILGSEDDIIKFTDFLISSYNLSKDKEYLFVGHGSEKYSNEEYFLLQNILIEKGFSNVKISVLKGNGSISDYLRVLTDKVKDKEINIYPLFINAGVHLKKDMLDYCEQIKNYGYKVNYYPIPLSEKF